MGAGAGVGRLDRGGTRMFIGPKVLPAPSLREGRQSPCKNVRSPWSLAPLCVSERNRVSVLRDAGRGPHVLLLTRYLGSDLCQEHEGASRTAEVTSAPPRPPHPCGMFVFKTEGPGGAQGSRVGTRFQPKLSTRKPPSERPELGPEPRRALHSSAAPFVTEPAVAGATSRRLPSTASAAPAASPLTIAGERTRARRRGAWGVADPQPRRPGLASAPATPRAARQAHAKQEPARDSAASVKVAAGPWPRFGCFWSSRRLP